VVPEEWHQGIIIFLYKGKGSKSDCSNCRGTTLLSVLGKLFAHIILARIKPTLLSHRRPQQSGFTPGRSTCDCIATLCNIGQRRQDFSHPAFAAFVDLCAVFDSLSRPTLWLLLTRLGILDKIVRLFRVLYDNSVSCVVGGLTAHALKSRLVFARAVCWPRIYLPQTWIGCWTGLLNLARLVWRLARAPSLIWILLMMSLLTELLELLVTILEAMASEAASLGLEVNWQSLRGQKCKLWVAGSICH